MNGEPRRLGPGTRAGRRVGTHLVAVRSPVRRTVAPLVLAGIALLAAASGCVGCSTDERTADPSVASSTATGVPVRGGDGRVPAHPAGSAVPLPTSARPTGEPLPTSARPNGEPLPTSVSPNGEPLPGSRAPGAGSVPASAPPVVGDSGEVTGPAATAPAGGGQEAASASTSSSVPGAASGDGEPGSSPADGRVDAPAAPSPADTVGEAGGDRGDDDQACGGEPVVVVSFGTDSTALPPGVGAQFDEVLATLQASTARIDVIGHADRRDTAYVGGNDKLSEDRAGAVAAELTRRGVDPTRIHTEGRGTRDPLPGNGDGRFDKERRAEVFLNCSDGSS